MRTPARRRAGRAAEAVLVLEDALDFYLRIGAQRGGARVEAALRGLGIRRRRTGARGGRQWVGQA